MIRAVHTWTDTKDGNGNAGARSVLGEIGDDLLVSELSARATLTVASW